jgi:PPK2 family polyphosphate:nucleotide phosphotransferase
MASPGSVAQLGRYGYRLSSRKGSRPPLETPMKLDTDRLDTGKLDTDAFRVRHERKLDLDKWPTRAAPLYESKEHYRALLGVQVEALRRQQDLLYASNAHAVLVIFQAMDAAGKDGAIKHVMSGVNPQGVEVHSFNHPSGEELKHDFLWRAERNLPERGRIGIFNRSYYEEVLIVRVHPELLEAEGVPDAGAKKKTLWEDRFESMVALEKHLHRNGTRVLKFFLHISKEEQRKRFLARLDDPEKNWKFSMADVRERRCWKQYMKAYEECLSATSTRTSPWFAVPADDKENARLIVAQTLVRALEDLDMSYPEIDAPRRRELKEARALLVAGD